MASSFFDFHFHPMFKQYISNYEAQYPSTRPITNLVNNVQENNDIMNYLDETVFHFLDSQCSFNEMTAGNEMLGIANIVTLEYAIAASDNLTGFILKEPITAPLDKHYFNLVSGGNISYYQLLLKELNLYSRIANIGTLRDPTANGLVTILTRKNNTIDLDNLTGTTLALSIEGGHNLNRTLANKAVTADNLDTAEQGNFDKIYADFQAGQTAVMSPAQSLQRLFAAMWQEDMDLVYLTLTHLTYINELPMATHAFGMKMLKHLHFYPSGSGITADGISLINAAYNMSPDNGVTKTPILIDLKHTSLKSRLDFYDYYNAQGFKLPIIATHIGITGYSIANWKTALTDDYGNDFINKNNVYQVARTPKLAGIDNQGDELTICKYQFNPWTINLMDEDIVAILDSNGMIGMSLDARILGATATLTNKEYDPTEYLSVDEYNYFFNEQHNIMDESPGLPAPDADPSQSFDLGSGYDGDENTEDPEREVACLAFNILHILAVGKCKTTTDPWQHITIGSDYDGLIEPLSVAYNCTSVADVETRLCSLIVKAEATYLYHNPIPASVGTILPRTSTGDVDTADVNSKIRSIMYDNGKNFLKKWYNNSW